MADARMLPIIERLEKEHGTVAWMEDYRALLRGALSVDEFRRRRAEEHRVAMMRLKNLAFHLGLA